VHTFRAFRPSVAAAAIALLAVAACSDSSTKGDDHSNAAAIAITGGQNQVGVPGTPLAAPIAVRVTNSQGNPVAGKAVSFAITRGGGTVASSSVSTDDDGIAQTSWTLGAGSVKQQLKATAGSASQLATATVDTTRSLFLMPLRDTVSVNDTIWVTAVSGTTGLNGEVRGAVQESIVNSIPTAARMVTLYYMQGEFFDYTGNGGTLNLVTSGPTNTLARQTYLRIGYVAMSAGKDVNFAHAVSGFFGARTFSDLRSSVSVVGATVHIR
jgi:Big-like domain-containing protein